MASQPRDQTGEITRTRPGAASDERLALGLIAVFLAIHLILMVVLGFGVDEDYTLANAYSFALSYFDHPPLHQWLAQLSIRVFGLTPWVRLPFVLLFAGTSWLVFALTRHLFGGKAALWTLGALNMSAFFTVAAGGWVVPDGALLFCLAAATLSLARVFFPGEGHVRPWLAWAKIGLWIGLAGLSKYNAILFVIGLALFVLTSPRHRRWIAQPAVYGGVAIALALAAPVFLWNWQNDWVSFTFQGGRGVPSGPIHWSHLFGMVGGELALLLPWIAVPLIAATLAGLGSARRGDEIAFLLCLAIPAIVFFTVVPLWGARGLPHWPMPGWFFLFPLLGAWLARGGTLWLTPRGWAILSGTGLALVIGLAASQASSGWMRSISPRLFAAGDPTLESLPWGQIRTARAFTAPPPDFIAAVRWADAAKLAVAFDGIVPVSVFSNDPRQFAFTHGAMTTLHTDAVIVIPATRADHEIKALAPYFRTLGTPETVWLGRAGMHEIPLVVIRATDLIRLYPWPYGVASHQAEPRS